MATALGELLWEKLALAAPRMSMGAIFAQAWFKSISDEKIFWYVSEPRVPTRKRQGCSL